MWFSVSQQYFSEVWLSLTRSHYPFLYLTYQAVIIHAPFQGHMRKTHWISDQVSRIIAKLRPEISVSHLAPVISHASTQTCPNHKLQNIIHHVTADPQCVTSVSCDP